MADDERKGSGFVSFRVDCIGMTESASTERRVITIGGTKLDGLPWRLSESEAISGLEKGSWALHVEGPNLERVALVVAFSGGNKYLKADAHDQGPDLLRGLPECKPVEMPKADTSTGS